MLVWPRACANLRARIQTKNCNHETTLTHRMRLRSVVIHIVCAYPIPLLFAVVSLLHGQAWRGTWFGLNGLGWSLLLLSLPWTLGRIIFLRNTGGVVVNAQQRRIAGAIAIAYIPMALLCVAAISLSMGFVGIGQARDFLLLMFFPFSLPGLI